MLQTLLISQGGCLNVKASLQTRQHIHTSLVLHPVQRRQLLHAHFDICLDECLVVWSKHNALRGHLDEARLNIKHKTNRYNTLRVP